ncbi:hypothetical protein [Ochrobactrum sp. A-1]|uniref:hypothetical protein n=1 Tax=Ochrobactrum sp. A-1 TaxID=2920940 RepID=UPI001F0B5A29
MLLLLVKRAALKNWITHQDACLGAVIEPWALGHSCLGFCFALQRSIAWLANFTNRHRGSFFFSPLYASCQTGRVTFWVSNPVDHVDADTEFRGYAPLGKSSSKPLFNLGCQCFLTRFHGLSSGLQTEGVQG